jgi:DNA-directed RNA polymerase specialized sigma24 family protein
MAMKKLSYMDRCKLVYCYYSNASSSELALEFGINTSTVYKIWYKYFDQFRETSKQQKEREYDGRIF